MISPSNASQAGRRLALATLAGVALSSGFAGCASLGGRTVEVPHEQLSEALARRFPFNTRWLGVFDVEVSMPRLKLLPEQNRIGAEIDVSAGQALFGRAYRGGMAMDGGLRFEPADGTLRLSDVRVGRLVIDGLPAAFQGQVSRLGGLIAEQLLEDSVIHTLDEAAAARLKRSGLAPQSIRVTPYGLSIDLRPAA